MAKYFYLFFYLSIWAFVPAARICRSHFGYLHKQKFKTFPQALTLM